MHGTTTKLETAYAEELNFPAVTVCGLNRFTKQLVEMEKPFVQDVLSK